MGEFKIVAGHNTNAAILVAGIIEFYANIPL